jgi:phosphate/sulfate permease
MVVVLAESLVLFIFSSSALSDFFVRLGLPAIPMVPVSSSQVVVGCVIGIGLYKGARNINYKLLGQIALGWISTPLLSGIITYISLFFMRNIFNIQVGYKAGTLAEGNISGSITSLEGLSEIFKYLLLGVVTIGFLVLVYYYILERKRIKELHKSEERFWKYLK